MQEFWHRLGRSDALSWPVLVVVCGLQIVGSFTSNVPIAGREVLFFVCAVIAVVPVFVVWWIAKNWVNPHLRDAWRPASTLAAFFVAAVTRAQAFDQLTLLFGFTSESQFVLRIYGSISSLFVGAIVASALFTRARDYSERNLSLAESVEALQIERANIETHVEQRRMALVTTIQRELYRGLAELSGSDPDQDATRLRSLIDDVVRPISQSLSKIRAPELAEVAPSAKTRINWRSVTRFALFSNPIRPVWITLWFAAGAFQFYSVATGMNFTRAYPAALVTFFATSALMRAVWPLLTKRFGLVARGITFGLLVLMYPLPLGIVNDFIGAGQILTPRIVIPASIYFASLAWAVALVSSAGSILRTTQTELTDANERLERRVTLDNVNARHFEEGIQRVLHGPVQDAISASIKRIQAMPENTELSASDVATIRQPIEEALIKLGQRDMVQRSVEAGIGDLANLWTGVVAISSVWDASTLSTLRRAPMASSVVLELVREAVSNAIRHGDASEISVRIRLTSNGRDVELLVANNGMPVDEAVTAGIGSQLFDDLTLSWSRSNSENLVVLEAIVPLESMAA